MQGPPIALVPGVKLFAVLLFFPAKLFHIEIKAEKGRDVLSRVHCRASLDINKGPNCGCATINGSIRNWSGCMLFAPETFTISGSN